MEKQKKREYSAEKFADLYNQTIGETEYAEAINARGVKVYRNRSTKAGDILNLNICAVWNARGEASKAKAARRKQSPEVIERRNARETERRIIGLLNANFGEDDYTLFLSFDDETIDARKALQWFIRKCADEHKKNGAAFRYLYMIERADRDGVPLRQHIHIFVDGELSREWYEDVWRHRYGIANGTRLMPDENGLTGIAKYIHKAPRGEKRVRRWACSRNLKKPEERRSTRLPNGKTLSKRFLYDLVSGKYDAKEVFETVYRGYRFLGMQIRQSEYVSGVYVDIKMSRIKPERRKARLDRLRDMQKELCSRTRGEMRAGFQSAKLIVRR